MKKNPNHKNTKSKIKPGKAKTAKVKIVKSKNSKSKSRIKKNTKIKSAWFNPFGLVGFKSVMFKMVVLICVLFGLFFAWRITFQSVVKENVFYRVESGATISSVATDIRSANFINSEDSFKAIVILMGGNIQSGDYEIKPGNSVWRIAKMMRSGDIASTKIVIPEGLTIKQIKNLLIDVPTLKGGVECDNKTDAKISKVCNLKEGDLFPDTYRVARGANRLDVLELMRKKMEAIKTGWEKSGHRTPKSIKTWNEVITLASIVQKETSQKSEMPIVASVYLNRLHKRMRLQADPTVVYVITNGLGDMQERQLLSKHLKVKSPYNTYVNYGLPPAPIANVGRDAIAAVLNPADTNYLFFVADGQGGHKFARSYEEHRKNQSDWRKIKKALNLKK